MSEVPLYMYLLLRLQHVQGFLRATTRVVCRNDASERKREREGRREGGRANA